MARVIFLGTAGSSAVIGKQLLASGGIILQVEDLQFHLDPGPGALVKAKENGINLQNNTAILVSHNHINHCNDLNVVVEAMTHGGLEHRGVVLGSKSVLLDTPEQMAFLTKYHQQMPEKIIPLEKDHKVAVELVEIHALPAEHTDQHALGFKFYCPGFIMGYSGDTALTPQLLQELGGCDLLILNVPYPGKSAVGLNLDTESATKIISYVKPKFAIITHFGMEMLRADPLVEAREIQRMTGVETVAARDGLSIATEGYSKHTNVRGYR